MKIGDLVLKDGDYDRGCMGIILEINTNSLKITILKILKFNGDIVNWYANRVKKINKRRKTK